MPEDSALTKQSLIRPYSLGIAAANISFGQKELEVTPLEDLSQLDGELTDAQTTLECKGVDKDGNTFATAQKTSNSIRALWLPLDSHRTFPPLIRRGHRVMIWRVADSDKYYWTDMGIDNTTLRRDIMTFLIPNSGKEGEDSLTPDTAYFIEVNTVDKHITIQTNKNDGEEFAYLFQLNPGGGNATICDDVGNYIQLDSRLQKLILKNQAGSEISIEKGKGLFKTRDEITLDTQTLNLLTKTINSNSDKFNLKSSSLDITVSTFNSNASSYTWAGNAYKVNTSTITHNGTNIGKSHGHLNVRSGPDTSGPVSG